MFPAKRKRLCWLKLKGDMVIIIMHLEVYIMAKIRYVLPLGLTESLERSEREKKDRECSYGREVEGSIPPAIGSTVSYLPFGQEGSGFWTRRHEVKKVEHRVALDMWIVDLARCLSVTPHELSRLKEALELAGWKRV